MRKMEKFDLIYDDMSNIYSELENIMGEIYQEINVNPNNDKNNLLLKIGCTFVNDVRQKT